MSNGMLAYREYEKKVFDWLMSKHKGNSEFTFSVRKKASKGSESDYFIGTENSNYFATSFWNIPCGYPGSSIDLIVLGFSNNPDGYTYWVQFMFTRNPNGKQNEAALELIQELKPKIKELFPDKFKNNSPDAKMEKFTVCSDESIETTEKLFMELDPILSQVIPVVNDKIELVKQKYPSFTAHRYTKEEFDELLNKMDERFKKYSNEENSDEDTEVEPPEFSIGEDFNPPLNQILYGPPGTGKTYRTLNHALAILENDKKYLEDEDIDRDQLRNKIDEYKKKRQVRFVTFHPSFTYEDFVEGIKPVLNSSEGSENNDVSYIIEDGIFKDICNSASETKKLKLKRDGDIVQKKKDVQGEKRFVLIIDEINRGNIPSIFGELITLLEPDKRTEGNETTTVTLPYSKKQFEVPSNLYVIGTMNTADRSVEALDIALRRRFEFKPIYPDENLINQPEGFEVDLKAMLTTINNRIECLLDRDHTIGHSYLMGIHETEEPAEKLKQIFKYEFIPLLEEYFYGQLQNVGLVLGSDFIESKFKESHSTTLFPSNFSPQETPNERVVYRVLDPTKFNTIQPFINIYAKS